MGRASRGASTGLTPEAPLFHSAGDNLVVCSKRVGIFAGDFRVEYWYPGAAPVALRTIGSTQLQGNSF